MSNSVKAAEKEIHSPLLTAIVEFRELVYRIFEEQKSQLQVGDSDSGLGLAPVGTSASQSSTAPASSQVVHSQSPVAIEADIPIAVRKPTPRIKESPPPDEPETPGSDAFGPGRSEDSRQRLAALAKLLDKRLKPTSFSPLATGTIDQDSKFNAQKT